MIAHRHAPGPVEAVAPRLADTVAEIALKEIVVRRHGAAESPANQRGQLQRRQTLARALHRDVGLGHHGPRRKIAGGDQALGQIFPVDQFALAERAFGKRFAARRFQFADAGDQRLEFLRLEARGMVGTFHLAIERDVALDHDGAQRDGADRDRDAAFMAGIADRWMYALQRFHEAQMDIVERGRVGALAMQQHVGSRAIIEELGGGADFVGRAHAGGDDQGLSGGGEARQQRKVGEVGGGDLVGLDAERLQRGNAGRVPRRAEIANAFRRAIGRDAALLVGGQFEAAQQVEGVFDGEVVVFSGQAGSAIDLVKLAHLELGAIGAGGYRRIDQHHRAIEVAIMVVADFGNDEARLAVANHAIADPDESGLVRWRASGSFRFAKRADNDQRAERKQMCFLR